MAFTPARSRAPVAIGAMYIRLTDKPSVDTILTGPDGDEDHIVEAASRGAQYSLVVEYNDGSTETVAGNLVPHITSAQITALISFIAGLRAQAVEQILP